MLISNPLTWLPLTNPSALAQNIPVINDVLAVDVVEVVMMMDPLLLFDPMVFPSPASVPPIYIPDPLVCIPVKTAELAAVGTEETEIEAIVLPRIYDAGEELLVVNKMPWYDRSPVDDE